MRRSSFLPQIAFLALLVAGAFLFFQHQTDGITLRTLQRSEQVTRERYSRAIDDIAAIQDSLNAIALETPGLQASAGATESRLSPEHGDEALARVAELRAGIQRARTRIEQLESRLAAAGSRVTGLEHMLANLKLLLADREQLVASLSVRVDSLQTSVTNLATSVVEHELRIAAQQDSLERSRRELGTVYYVVGTRQDLLKSGVVVARGGVFGLGKTLDPTGIVDEAAFQAVDTDQDSVISIAAPHARVLSPQPPDSYSLEPVNGRLELHIRDARAFRKVRHVVIVTA